MGGAGTTTLGLWALVLASGVYHGLSPAMGWPLAVSAALMERDARALLVALGYLAVGHLLAMLVMMLPFAVLGALLAWQREIQTAAAILLLGFGAVELLRRRHPRVLSRIRPTRLGLWSFAVAIAHGAGLMLVPVYLGLCRPTGLDERQNALGWLISANLSTAVVVSVTHATAMIVTGGLFAWLTYRHLGLRLVARTWFNLGAVWATSLILIGGLSLAMHATGE